MWIAVITIASLALAAGTLLAIAARRLPNDTSPAVESVNLLLPQTQCAQCGFPGCKPYAEAIVEDGAPIDLCPPGGNDAVRQIASLLGRPMTARSTVGTAVAAVARIDAERCIGCTHCRTACPVDAIVGAHQYLHTVLTAECTGCELCIEPCPVDCISMELRRE